MNHRDRAIAPWTARTYREQRQRPSNRSANRPYEPNRQIPAAELAATRATLAWLGDRTDEQRPRALLNQAADVLTEAVRGCERRVARSSGAVNIWTIAHTAPATRATPPSPADIAAARDVLLRMLDGGDLLTRWEGAALSAVLPLLDHPTSTSTSTT